MKSLIFQWDKKKEKVNVQKHGVSFEEARAAFYDEHALQFFDPDHSEDEERFILPGTNHKLKTLVVCHCFREAETVIRIISARTADKDEQDAYWSQRR
ncbi:MAG: BrnT family toxin [Pseudohongiellaceae bacterium]